MAFKLNISEKGKSWKLEIDNDIFIGKMIGDIVRGEEIKPELEGYELKISGGSDSAGFPLSKDVEGLGLKSVLLKRGWGMRTKGKGLRLRKTVRGKVISNAVSQINLNVEKTGKKPLSEIFPEQNKPKEKKKEGETKTEEKKE
ncbi:MAG: eS6 family ribosomal protein [Candidatus Pacearchaeota archaeon]|nr:eS6 family ribosomal protein [Candidatus Pacearchaeota archaeon]